jgi:hypothetical protein
MGFDLRLPNITGASEREQLTQIKNFLYQHIEQLQFVLNSLGTSNATVVVNPTTRQGSSSSQPVSSEATFNSIKALIIKSADIVNAYYDVINNRLASEYVAQSAFGTFSQQSSQDITQNATYIEQLFSNVQQITTDIDNLNFTLGEVYAHIRSGHLYDDGKGLPVYGLEIGQKNLVDGKEVFNKFARFTSDRLSFYDQNGAELAYISDYKLYIRAVEITESFKIGGYIDIVMANGDVITKWVGRS